MEGWEGRERMGDRKDETAAAVEPKGERLPQWKQNCDPGCPQTRPWLQQMLTVCLDLRHTSFRLQRAEHCPWTV